MSDPGGNAVGPNRPDPCRPERPQQANGVASLLLGEWQESSSHCEIWLVDGGGGIRTLEAPNRRLTVFETFSDPGKSLQINGKQWSARPYARQSCIPLAKLGDPCQRA